MTITERWNRRFRILMGAGTAVWIGLLILLVIRALLADHAAYSANPKRPPSVNLMLFRAIGQTILPYALVMLGAAVGYFVTRK